MIRSEPDVLITITAFRYSERAVDLITREMPAPMHSGGQRRRPHGEYKRTCPSAIATTQYSFDPTALTILPGTRSVHVPPGPSTVICEKLDWATVDTPLDAVSSTLPRFIESRSDAASHPVRGSSIESSRFHEHVSEAFVGSGGKAARTTPSRLDASRVLFCGADELSSLSVRIC